MPIEAHNMLEVVEGWRVHTYNFVRDDVPRLVVILLLATLFIRILRMISTRLVRFSKTGTLPSGVRSQQLRTLASVIYSVGLFVISFIALLELLELFQINIGPLLASAGIAGLAIGFGAQTLVKDVINGFFILLENQFDVGDVVKLAGVSGAVESLTLRRTVLRDADGTLHTIPNSEIKIVSNLTRDWTQVAMHIGVDYSENSERVIGLLKEVGAELRGDPRFAELLVSDPEVPGIEKVSGSEVEYLMLVKTKPGQQYALTRELRRRIKECLQKNNIKPGAANRLYVLESSQAPASK